MLNIRELRNVSQSKQPQIERCHFWRIVLLFCVAAIMFPARPAAATAVLKVVASAPDYASIAELIGGEQVKVTSLTNGVENIHNFVATPSKMLDLRDADLFIHTGLDLELWVADLLKGSRNARIQDGQPGNVDCSKNIRLKEIPKQLSRAQGDIHIYGNPHYMLDPINHILVARTIRDALKAARPGQAEYFDSRYVQFEQRMKDKLAEWLVKLKPYKGTKLGGYHNVLPYFLDRFGLEVVGYIEEKPGISPSAAYTAKFIDRMKESGAKVILMNTWAERQTADAVARATGAELVVFPEWVRGVADTPDVFALFDYRVNSLVAALQRVTKPTTSENQ
jgi:zinc/manganese transport system substrate-binding protein